MTTAARRGGDLRALPLGRTAKPVRLLSDVMCVCLSVWRCARCGDVVYHCAHACRASVFVIVAVAEARGESAAVGALLDCASRGAGRGRRRVRVARANSEEDADADDAIRWKHARLCDFVWTVVIRWRAVAVAWRGVALVFVWGIVIRGPRACAGGWTWMRRPRR